MTTVTTAEATVTRAPNETLQVRLEVAMKSLKSYDGLTYLKFVTAATTFMVSAM